MLLTLVPDSVACFRDVGLCASVTGEEMYFTSNFPDDMARLIEKWRLYMVTEGR